MYFFTLANHIRLDKKGFRKWETFLIFPLLPKHTLGSQPASVYQKFKSVSCYYKKDHDYSPRTIQLSLIRKLLFILQNAKLQYDKP